MRNTNDWAYIWVCRLIRQSEPVVDLPFGWCVYREALDWD